jgi:hypothetical protein
MSEENVELTGFKLPFPPPVLATAIAAQATI